MHVTNWEQTLTAVMWQQWLINQDAILMSENGKKRWLDITLIIISASSMLFCFKMT